MSCRLVLSRPPRNACPCCRGTQARTRLPPQQDADRQRRKNVLEVKVVGSSRPAVLVRGMN